MAGCAHKWGEPPEPANWRRNPPTWPGALLCESCGVPWPGRPLPVPYFTEADRPKGQGEAREQPGWGERVRAMSASLEELTDF